MFIRSEKKRIALEQCEKLHDLHMHCAREANSEQKSEPFDMMKKMIPIES